ncbi:MULTISPECIES: hypothetical protein [Prochlorococcus]|uniref:hypothetical protein n=1 Tax=Prochlorococcus TaxID=1218 RepID=UPI000A3E6CE4|nr:hypothetical protein [Prochlorococcus marinus]
MGQSRLIARGSRTFFCRYESHDPSALQQGMVVAGLKASFPGAFKINSLVDANQEP